MIIMLRIIAGLAILALTACDAVTGRDDDRRRAAGDGMASDAMVHDDAGLDTAPRLDAAPGVGTGTGAGTGADFDARAGRGTAPGAGTAAGNGRHAVVFVGTSLTAGYGVGEDLAYPAVVQQLIDSAGLPFRAVNSGISGETSAGGLRRIDWVLQRPVDVLVLELGANDGLRGIDPELMRRNLDRILARTRDRYPDAALVVVGMEAPPNLGDAYTSHFRRAFGDVARLHGATLVPFLLDGIAGEERLNQADGIHPNAEGHRIMARTVWSVIEPVLRGRAAQPPARAVAR
jgi:acyl-CoA thioesterase I